MSVSVKFRTHKARVKFESYAAAAKAAGIPYITFYKRIETGWTFSEASKTPVRKYVKRPTETTVNA